MPKECFLSFVRFLSWSLQPYGRKPKREYCCSAEDGIQLALKQVSWENYHISREEKSSFFYLPNCLQPPPHSVHTTVFSRMITLYMEECVYSLSWCSVCVCVCAHCVCARMCTHVLLFAQPLLPILLLVVRRFSYSVTVTADKDSGSERR